MSIILSFCFLFCAAGRADGQNRFSVKKGNIPPEFSSFKDTLLVVDPGTSHNYGREFPEFLKQTFDSNYHGPYKIVDRHDLTPKRYPKHQYRYVFVSDVGFESHMGPTGSHQTDHSSSFIFGIFDALHPKEIYQVNIDLPDRRLVKEYVIALDNERNGH